MTKIIKSKEERENKAIALNTQVLESMAIMRIRTIILASAFKEIRDDELFKELNYPSFEVYVSTPEIGLKPSTANRYISIYKDLIENKKIEVNEVKEIAINKLDILRKTEHPEKWIHDAKTLAYGDFKKRVYEKEFGIDIKDDDIGDYIKKKKTEESQSKGCPHWDKKRQICKLDKK